MGGGGGGGYPPHRHFFVTVFFEHFPKDKYKRSEISPHCCRRQRRVLRRPPKQEGRQKARSKSLRNMSILASEQNNPCFNSNEYDLHCIGGQLNISPVMLSALCNFPLKHFPPATSRFSSFTFLTPTVAIPSLPSAFSKTLQFKYLM